MNSGDGRRGGEVPSSYCPPYRSASISLDANKSNASMTYSVPPKDAKNLHMDSKSDDIEMYVENMLNELKGKMQNLSNNLLSKVDNMEKSLDELEQAMLSFSNKADG
ncbi:Heat shock factor binding protein [Plasmodium coatneyi]|uniref:Heat shock factor binding protein n=1 Tax=Plasmodium coatneyi TaxID=208452 RepID=A0A1B1DZU8_9APIC|nr:Heat shock factor binding protein [Plasmodium coatneyi]ANQ08304.1 Heat shock factor binding protein [Plasmodium coatneyi]